MKAYHELCVMCIRQDSCCLLMSGTWKASERVGWIKRIVIMAYYVVSAIDWWCARLISPQRNIFRDNPLSALHRCIAEYERALITQRKMAVDKRIIFTIILRSSCFTEVGEKYFTSPRGLHRSDSSYTHCP